MIKIVLIVKEDFFHADTTDEFFQEASSSEYKDFHDMLVDIDKKHFGSERLLNCPIDIAMLDKYKGMLIVMGIKFKEIKQSKGGGNQ